MKQLLRNITMVFASSFALKAVNVVAFILLARRLGIDQGGIFSLCTSYLALFSSLTWGFDELLTRQIARNHQVASSFFKLFVKWRLVYSCGLYLILLFVTVVILKYPTYILYPILVMTIALFTDGIGNTAQSLLSAFDGFSAFFVANLLNTAIRIAALIYFLFSPLEIITFSLVWTVGSFVSALILFIVAVRTLGNTPTPPVGMSKPELVKELRLIVGFLVIGFLSTLEYQMDVIILSAFQGENEVGLYTSVTTILFSLTLLAQAYRMVIYPVMTRYKKNEPAKLGKLCANSYDLLWTVSLPMAVGIAILAPEIVPFVYGEAFEPAVQVTRVIIWTVIFIFLNVPNSRLMLASEHQRMLLIFLVASTGMNVLLNFLLVPQFASTGAAVSRLVSTATYFFISFFFVFKQVDVGGVSLLKKMARTGLSAAIMAAAVWPLREQSLLISISVGIIFYLVSLGIIRRADFIEQRVFLNAVKHGL